MFVVSPVFDRRKRDRSRPLERLPGLRARRPAGRQSPASTWPTALKGKRSPSSTTSRPTARGSLRPLARTTTRRAEPGSALGRCDHGRAGLRRARRRKVKASGADVFYWGGLYTEGGLILRPLRDHGRQGSVRLGRRHRLRRVRRDRRTGGRRRIATFGPDQRGRPEAKDVVAKFRAKKFEPESYTLYSYAARSDLALQRQSRPSRSMPRRWRR